MEAGSARRPRKLRWKLELVLLFNFELKFKLILLKLLMNPVLPKLVICGCVEEQRYKLNDPEFGILALYQLCVEV